MNNKINSAATVVGAIPLPFYRGFRDIYDNRLTILCEEYDEEFVFNDDLYLPLKDGCEVEWDCHRDNVFVNIEFCDNWRQSMLEFMTDEKSAI